MMCKLDRASQAPAICADRSLSPLLSVAIIARDEERYIADALASVAGLASDIVVLLDDRSRDGTADLCRAHGVRLYVEPWRGFPAQRNRALEVCVGEWVLFLDADERVSVALRGEIQQVIRQRTGVIGYWIPRLNEFFDQTLRGGGWYPDHQLRLFRRQQAHFAESRLVHEVAQLDGPIGSLEGHIYHLNIEHVDELWRKQSGYAIQEAQMLYVAGRRARWRNFVGAPLREFYRRYVVLQGYRDGLLGLFLCATLAYFEGVKFLHLKGLERAL